MNEHTDFLEFTKDLFLKPKIFFQKYFNPYGDKPFFGVALFIFSVGYGVGRLTSTTKENSFTDNWIGYWTMAIFGGGLGGYIVYLIGSWFYNLRVKWSDGTPDLERSKYLFLYSGVVSGAPAIVCALVAFVLKDKPSGTISIYYSIVTILFLMFFNLYSVFLSFCGVTAITDANYQKARMWFFIIPIALYSISYLAALWTYLNYFNKFS